MFETNTNGKQWRGMAGDIQAKSASRFTVAILCAVMMAFTFLPKASADDWDKKTIITFGDTVQIPGQALPAGTYVFKLMRTTADSHVVQIFDQDERKLVATLMAVPAIRQEPAKRDQAIRFEERLSAEPQAVKVWFRPGDTSGQEFVYHKDQSQLLAKNSPWAVGGTTTEVANNEAPATPVAPPVTEPTEQTAPADNSNSSAVTPSDTANETEPAPAPSPRVEDEDTPDAGIPSDADQNQTPTTPQSTPTTTDEKPDKLPKTGSELPLFGMIGSFSLVLGALTSAYRRRSR